MIQIVEQNGRKNSYHGPYQNIHRIVNPHINSTESKQQGPYIENPSPFKFWSEKKKYQCGYGKGTGSMTREKAVASGTSQYPNDSIDFLVIIGP